LPGVNLQWAFTFAGVYLWWAFSSGGHVTSVGVLLFEAARWPPKVANGSCGRWGPRERRRREREKFFEVFS